MNRYSRSFKALWMGEIISEFGGAAGGIVNGLLMYELTGSKEWMGVLWLIYFIPSLILQGVSAPFLNHVVKEKALKNIQLIRAGAYFLPFTFTFIGTEAGTVTGLVILQCILGLMQPLYATLSFSILPALCHKDELVNANAVLDGTIRLMSLLSPGLTSLFLLISPLHYIYGLTSIMFLLSYLALSRIQPSQKKKAALWTKTFWWTELKEGYRLFFQYSKLLKLTLLSSTVQFAVGAAMVLNIPLIKDELNGQSWEYAIFAGAFPVGYVIGMFLLTRLPKSEMMMYMGLIGGGLSFVCLYFVQNIPLAWILEGFGGLLFPFFNAQSAALFQSLAPKDRIAQLSAVRLLFHRITMPIGIVVASSSAWLALETRQMYAVTGIIIILPGLYVYVKERLGRNKEVEVIK